MYSVDALAQLAGLDGFYAACILEWRIHFRIHGNHHPSRLGTALIRLTAPRVGI